MRHFALLMLLFVLNQARADGVALLTSTTAMPTQAQLTFFQNNGFCGSLTTTAVNLAAPDSTIINVTIGGNTTRYVGAGYAGTSSGTWIWYGTSATTNKMTLERAGEQLSGTFNIGATSYFVSRLATSGVLCPIQTLPYGED